MTVPTVLPPTPLSPDDDLTALNCGAPEIHRWLRSHAHRNHGAGFSRVFVQKAVADRRVVAVATLSAHMIERDDAKEAFPKPPRQIPGFLLGQLAVDSKFQGQGIGQGLFAFIGRVCLRLARETGAAYLALHPLNARAADYWISLGFRPVGAGLYLIRLADLAAAGAEGRPEESKS